MTVWWLPYDCLMTAWWLPDEWLMISHLYFKHTFKRGSKRGFKKISKRGFFSKETWIIFFLHKKLCICRRLSWLFNEFGITLGWLWDDSRMTLCFFEIEKKVNWATSYSIIQFQIKTVYLQGFCSKSVYHKCFGIQLKPSKPSISEVRTSRGRVSRGLTVCRM